MRGVGCSKSAAPDHPSLHVKRQLGVTKDRECFRFCHLGPDVVVEPFNNDLDTLERAVKERVFFVKNIDTSSSDQFVPPPKPQKSHYPRSLKKTRKLLTPLLPSTAPLTHQQFVDTVRGRKKKTYEKALQRIEEEGLNLMKDSGVSVFVKYEKTDRTSKKDPVPRVISPRDPKYNLALGRYLRPMEERIFKSLGKLFGHPTVMKGYTTDDTAALLREKWDSFKNPVAIGLDASRFDQHVSLDALKFEHSIYLSCLRTKKHRRKLRNLLRCQLENKCVGYVEDGKISYKIKGTRMSGDMNTSLGNCILMCCMIYQYSLDKRIKVQLANNGDDCVVFMERCDEAKFSKGLFEWFWKMGFNMAIEPTVYEFEHIEFCQTRPVYDGAKYTMCRNPRTVLAKDTVCLKPRTFEAMLPLWIHAVGTGGIALAGGMPILNSFYSMLQRSGVSELKNRKGKIVDLDANEILPWYMRETNMKGDRVSSEPTPECRSSFYTAFDITPDEQIELENYFDSMSVDCKVQQGDWGVGPQFPRLF